MKSFAICLLLLLVPRASASVPENLDFASGTLAGWKGEGFYITTGTGRGPSLALGVSSSDCGKPGHKGCLQRLIAVPEDGGWLRCMAYAAGIKGTQGQAALDIRLEESDNRIIPKRVRVGNSWQTTAFILPSDQGKAREYLWDLSHLAGKIVRLVLIDSDDLPGHHLFSSGFRIEEGIDLQAREFALKMVQLSRAYHLTPMYRFDTRHFTALSNADDAFSELRMQSCELIYSQFFGFFKARGFSLQKPGGKLMVAIFDNQKGFEAYLGRKMSSAVMGIYDQRTNRLVIYDVGTSRALLEFKQHGQQIAKTIRSDQERRRYIDTMNRRANDYRSDVNIATLMHEVAHQLSFNTGLLSHEGDVPLWLAEGLACYCETTDNGAWQGIGEPNLDRLRPLASALAGNEKLLHLRDLIDSDSWIGEKTALQGYSQGWALFHYLMSKRPRALRNYLRLIQSRKSNDYRLDDFAQSFGSDLAAMEKKYLDYTRTLAIQYVHLQK